MIFIDLSAGEMTLMRRNAKAAPKAPTQKGELSKRQGAIPRGRSVSPVGRRIQTAALSNPVSGQPAPVPPKGGREI